MESVTPSDDTPSYITDKEPIDMNTYSNNDQPKIEYTLLFDVDKVEEAKKNVFKNLCFNCDGDHPLFECTAPKDHQKIRKNKVKFLKKKNITGHMSKRYHCEDNISRHTFKPGQMSEKLLEALGLVDDSEIPAHVYKMREAGYPPSYLNDIVKCDLHIEVNRKTKRSNKKKRKLNDGDAEENSEGEIDDSSGADLDVDCAADNLNMGKMNVYPGFNSSSARQDEEEGEPFDTEHVVDVIKTEAMSMYKEQMMKRSSLKSNIDRIAQEEADNKSSDDASDETVRVIIDRSGNLDPNEVNEIVQTPEKHFKHYNNGLPDTSNFQVNISPHLPFENLPGVIGSYKKILEILRKK